MKKILSFLTVLILAFAIAVPAFASGELVVDNADLLSGEEEAAVNSQLSELKSKYGLDIAVLTTNSTDDKSIMSYADDYYDQNGYAADGAILVINMDTENGGENRGWWLSTAGKGIEVFTDYGIEQIGGVIRDYLSSGDYAGAFSAFAKTADQFADQAINKGQAYDRDNYYVEKKEPHWILWAVVALIIGAVLGLIVTSAQKSRHKTVRSQTNATTYMREGSLNITNSTETFLYASIATTPIPQNNNRSGGGGGSSVHISSGGVSHGGGGGSF